MENNTNHNDAARKAAEAAFELEIARDTREFLASLSDEEDGKRPLHGIFILSGIAASLLVLVVCMWTINTSHSDAALARDYGINQITPRSGGGLVNASFTDAVKAYYSKDYSKAEAILTEVRTTSNKQLSDHCDWLSILISLQTAGSDSGTFNKQIEEVVTDENHEFHLQAVKLNKDLDHFWRFLVY